MFVRLPRVIFYDVFFLCQETSTCRLHFARCSVVDFFRSYTNFSLRTELIQNFLWCSAVALNDELLHTRHV